MNIKDTSNGKIFIHGRGIGGVGPADIKRRAHELADIDGRSGAEITDDDLRNARAELTGNSLPSSTVDDENSEIGITRDPSEPPSVSGHALPTVEGDDEEGVVERLALEGIDEAQHDQMLAARRRERRLEESGDA